MTIAIPRLDRSTAAERGLTIADFLVPVTVAERLNTRVRDSILVASGALFVYLTSLVVVPRPRPPPPPPRVSTDTMIPLERP